MKRAKKRNKMEDYKSPLLIVLGKTGMLHSKLDNTLNLEAYGKKILLLSVDNTHWPIDTLLLEEGITSHERQIADIVYESHDNKDLNIYDELIFVSKNAVKGFIKYLKTRHTDIRSLCGKKILCVGYKTKEYLEDMGIMADMTFDSSMELKNHIQGKALWINGNNVKNDEDSLSVYHFVSREFEIDDEYVSQLEIEIKYEGYIEKAKKEARRMLKMDKMKLSDKIDYTHVPNLSLEARQKLNEVKPSTLGQASRISGINPSDIQVLAIYTKEHNNEY